MVRLWVMAVGVAVGVAAYPVAVRASEDGFSVVEVRTVTGGRGLAKPVRRPFGR